MTTNTMTCALFSDRLMAYLERETDETTRAALERHAVTCADCGALLADLRKLRIDASNLRELAPSRDLWSDVSSRIETPVVPITGEWKAVSTPRRATRVRRWVRGGLMAASLVGAAAIGYAGASRGRATVVVASAPKVDTVVRSVQDTVIVGTAASQVASVTASTTPVAAAPRSAAIPASAIRSVIDVSAPAPAVRAYNTLVSDYDREIAKLHKLLEARRNQMDPMTVAVIEKNLQVIDAAIAECKKAIARDPASRFLMESLNQSLQAKVELMRTAALLPTRS